MSARPWCRALCALSAICASAAVGWAQPAEPAKPAAKEPPPRFELNAQLAVLATTGNAEAKTFGAGGEVVYRPDPWKYSGKLVFLQNEDDDVLRARSFVGLFRVDRRLSPRLTMFGQYDYLRDLFAGVEHRHTIAGGVSYALIDRAPHRLTVDGGLGFEHEDRLAEASTSSAVAITGTAYRWEIASTSSLTDELRFTFPFANSGEWKLDHIVALTAAMTSILSLRVSNTIRYAHEPVPGFEGTDTITAVTFVVSAKRPAPAP